MKKLIIYLLSFLLFVPFIWGKEEEEKKEKVEYPLKYYIIVTANRLEEPLEKVSASFTLITEQEIKERQAVTLAELLLGVPGFSRAQVGSIGHLTSLFIRGAESDHNLVLINGIPINDPASSYFDFSGLSLDDIERIEIVRGPQSTLYGSDALGGVINLITKKGGKGTKFNLSFIGGSDSTYKGSFSFSLGNESENFYFSSSHFSTEGNFKNDDYKNTTLSLRGELKIKNKSKLEVFARYTKTDLGIPFSSPQIPSFSRRQKTEETVISFPFSLAFSSLKLKLNLSYFKRNYIFKDPDAFWSYLNTKSNILRLDAQSDFAYSIGIFTIGGEWRKFFVTSEDNFGISIDNRKIDTRALFIQNQVHIDKTLFLTTGIRFDYHSEFGSHYSPRVTGALLLGNTKFKASIGSGFRAPRPYELYTFWGNRDLKPEISTNWEIGVEQKLFNSRIIAGITYFSSNIKDLIVYDFSTFKLQNLAQTEISGEEITLYFIPHRNFNLKLNYTHLIAQDKKKKEELLRRPRHTFNLNVNFKPVERFNINLNFIYVGKRKDLDEINFIFIENPPFNRIDLSSRWLLEKRIHLICKISNVLNKKYQEVYGYPSPNRGIYFGLEYSF